jgi:fructose-bisphosphate aldolase / 6-deoxy-5-ketofructose 1-phosphate synthase
MEKFFIPANVAKNKEKEYLKNLKLATLNTGKLFMFAGDQKVEHLNDDFFGSKISQDDAFPAHLFNIASEVKGVVLATQLGLISQYGKSYPEIPYLIKINSKTHLNKNKNQSLSTAWYDIDQIISFKKQSKLNIVGIGYTIYLGSNDEHIMLNEAAQLIYKAHQEGLIAVIWCYTRNDKIKNENDPHLIAGAGGVAACLGADFVKLNYPYQLKNQIKTANDFSEVIKAAGKTKVICVGGSQKNSQSLLSVIEKQINLAKTSGVAIGRNIHQRSLKDAILLTRAISSIIHFNYPLKKANKVLQGKLKMDKKLKKKNNILRLF